MDEARGRTLGALSDAFGNVVGSLNGSRITWDPAAVGRLWSIAGVHRAVLDVNRAIVSCPDLVSPKPAFKFNDSQATRSLIRSKNPARHRRMKQKHIIIPVN